MALNSGDHPLHFVSDEKSVVIAQGWLCAMVEVDIRVSLKVKFNFLRPGDLTLTAFKYRVYEKSKRPIARFFFILT